MSEFPYRKKLVIFRGVPVKKITLYDNDVRDDSDGLTQYYRVVGKITSLSSKPISMSLNDGIFFRLPIAATAALLSSI